MVCFSSLIIGLSFVISFIILGIAAELYYLLCYKKRITNREIDDTEEEKDHSPKFAKELPKSLFFWKKLNKKSEKNTSSDPPDQAQPEQDPELGYGEQGVDTEIMRLYNLCGPPKFLFTISEETQEDLESQKSKSRKGSRTRSLSDLVFLETPITTPLASPILKNSNTEIGDQNGFNFNPLFESISETELDRLKSSPPPKFKFLRDAEEKLLRRLVEEAERKGIKKKGENEQIESSFVRFVVGNNKQVIPLSSSPSKFRAVDEKQVM